MDAQLPWRMLLNTPGAQVEVIEREDGVLELRAQMAVPVSQAWFWTEEWQQREREADADVASARHTTHEDADAFLDALDG